MKPSALSQSVLSSTAVTEVCSGTVTLPVTPPDCACMVKV